MCFGPEIALFAASTLVSVMQARAQGRASSALQSNEAFEDQRLAERTRQEAAADAVATRRQGAREQAALRARLAASGIDVSSGSPLLALETAAGQTELDALTLINRGASRARSYESSAGSALLRAQDDREQARYKAAGSLLSGASRIFDKIPDDFLSQKTTKPTGAVT